MNKFPFSFKKYYYIYTPFPPKPKASEEPTRFPVVSATCQHHPASLPPSLYLA